MNDAEIREALLLVESRRLVPPQLADQVFQAMLTELERETKAPALRWRPSRWPLAMLETARERFEALPAYHSRTSVAANENAGNPDFETRWETEDWYQDPEHWRTAFGSSNTGAAGATGDIWVMSPDLFAQYDASTNVFAVRPSDEVAGESRDPSFFFDPNLQWWGTGSEGDTGKPSDQFFEENCSATSSEFLGRPATKLACDAKPRDLEIWLDDETGMLLRISTFDIVREITFIEFEPDFAVGLFDITPPPGAKKRWRGHGDPPPEYAVSIGTEVAARHQLVDGATDGLEIVEITAQDVWVIVTRCDNPSGTTCGAELRLVDARAGTVLATLASPQGFVFTDVVAAGEEIWAQLMAVSVDTPTPAAYVQRIDRERSSLTGPRIETGSLSGGLAQTDGLLWSASGRHRDVKIGRAEAFYHSLARIDPAAGDVTQFDLGADVMGVEAAGESLWVTTSAIDRRDPEKTEFALVEFDPVSHQVKRRVPIAGWPNSTTSGSGLLLTLFASDGLHWRLGIIDLASGELRTPQIGPPGAELGGMAVAAGSAWIASHTDDAVLKVDLKTLEVVGSVATGRQPASVRFAGGSVWVTHPTDGTLARIDVE